MIYFDLLEGLLDRPLFPVDIGMRPGPAWSVRNNLKMLLNSRQGCLPHLPDYGLPDVSSIHRDFPDSIASLQRAVGDAIRKYEPRLTNVEVILENKDDVRDILENRADKVFRATYLVTAELVTKFETAGIEFRTNIDAEGKIEIF